MGLNIILPDGTPARLSGLGVPGKPGKPGGPGKDGGYYTPDVEQVDENTVRMRFTPSAADMPEVDAAEITLPESTGKPGKSAYEYAREGGFVGTEEDFAELLAGNSVKTFGAVGDGVTDDTAAFQAALAAERVVRVYGGTYVLSDTLVIRPNCCLELSQDTVLKFINTSGNCIEMRSSATLRGNFAIIHVPYAFTGHVIDIVTTHDTARDTEPYTHWDPQWKRGRYIYDVCIVKANPSGLHYSTDGVCSGTGIYMSGDGNNAVRFIWGALLQGIRIAGAFTRGIHAINFDLAGKEDSAWNHDMRIEAVIQGCEIGVDLTNCNDVHLAVAVQPTAAENGTPYAKWGVYLNDCRYIDMSSSVIWDWNANNTLYTPGGRYTMVAMFGNCCGLVYNDFGYYTTSTPTRDRIYTDTPSNLKKMTIMQEPIDRWFKTVDGEPYFSDGQTEKPLVLRSELQEYFVTDRVKGFTDALAISTDTDGTVYNGVGYFKGRSFDSNGNVISGSSYAYEVATGFIPCKVGDVIRAQNIFFDKALTLNGNGNYLGGRAGIRYYDANHNFLAGQTCVAMIINGGTYYQTCEQTDDGFKITLNPGLTADYAATPVAYVRFCFYIYDFGDYPVISVNEEIKFIQAGFLGDGINVKGDAVVLTSPSGKQFYLSVADDGTVTSTAVE